MEIKTICVTFSHNLVTLVLLGLYYLLLIVWPKI
jgi:hypothetical protein